MAAARLALALAAAATASAGNHYCEYDIPAGTVVRRFEGKLMCGLICLSHSVL